MRQVILARKRSSIKMPIFLTYLVITTYVFLMRLVKAYICYKYQMSLLWILKTALQVYFFPVTLPLDIVQLQMTLRKFERERKTVSD